MDTKTYISTFKNIKAFPEWTIPVDLQELVGDVIAYADKPLKAADVQLTFNSNGSIFMKLCPPKLGRVVKGMITGCITNLVEAVHPRQIELNLVRTIEGVTITVEDNGPALAAETKEEMFRNTDQNSATRSFYHYWVIISKMKGSLRHLAQGKLGGLGLVLSLPLENILE